ALLPPPSRLSANPILPPHPPPSPHPFPAPHPLLSLRPQRRSLLPPQLRRLPQLRLRFPYRLPVLSPLLRSSRLLARQLHRARPRRPSPMASPRSLTLSAISPPAGPTPTSTSLPHAPFPHPTRSSRPAKSPPTPRWPS